MSKLTTSRPRPFNIHTIPLATHQALREALLKEKQTDFLEQTHRKKFPGGHVQLQNTT